MSNRLARRWFTAALLVAGATAVGPGTANAETSTLPAHVAPPPGGYGGYPGYPGYPDSPGYGHHFHHHYHPNCNNDPDSEFAMDPEVCPPSRNDPGNYGPDR